jgi:lipase
MKLNVRHWGEAASKSVVCVHGIGQHGGVFGSLGERLSAQGHAVVAVDLRGHGDSGREPPWNTGTHARDMVETLDALGIERATWIGHSFGGLVAAAVAADAPERTQRMILLEPGLQIPPAGALRSAEIERLDWSFATIDGAVNALMSNDTIVASPRDVVAKFVEDDVRTGPDGRFRFRFSPGAVVVAWSEMTLPAPPIARVPTLLVVAEKPLFDCGAQRRRYEDELGDLLSQVVVPDGHNVLWESPQETAEAIEQFLEPAARPAAI